jgi:alkylation response protein AidB-like acyl-CoA dehydrogenase
VDARLTEEQRSLRGTVARIVRKSAPLTVSELGDVKRTERLARDLANAGVLELRDPDVGPTGVEVALVAEQLALAAAEASFVGPILAADLCRRAGVAPPTSCTLALTRDLSRIALEPVRSDAVAFDAGSAQRALHVTANCDKFGLRVGGVAARQLSVDLTRPFAELVGEDVEELADAVLTAEDVEVWRAFGHMVLSADLLGSARAAHLATVAYAGGRTQYGRSIASFQAVQHLLAESLVLLEGAESAVNYAAWAIDAEPPETAIETALVSKLYCTNAARTVCETAIQIHGGIGNTWECMVHIHLRRVLVAGLVLGDEGALTEELVDRRVRAA